LRSGKLEKAVAKMEEESAETVAESPELTAAVTQLEMDEHRMHAEMEVEMSALATFALHEIWDAAIAKENPTSDPLTRCAQAGAPKRLRPADSPDSSRPPRYT
jgi:hypothetical protein